MFKIPSDRKWTQTNSSDIFGTIQRSRNMNFDETGYAKLAKRARNIYDLSAIERRILWIKYYQPDNTYWFQALDTTAVYSINGTTLAVTDESGTSNIPSADTTGGRNDAVLWQGYLYASSSTSLRRYNGSWSTNQYAAGLTGAGHLAVHEQKNYLAISQANQVLLINTSHVLQTTLTIPSDFQVTSLDYSNGFIIVGTRHVSNGNAKVFMWDGNSSVANYDYAVNSFRVDSVKRYGTTFIAVDGNGRLLKFNGGGFDLLAELPIYSKDVDWGYDGSAYLGRVISNGVVVDGDLILINLSPRLLLPSGDTAGHLFESYFEGGVWCYDPKVGLYPRYPHTSSLRVSNTIATSAVNTGTGIITVSSAPVTGTPIIYDNAGSTTLGGLTHREKYYAIYVTSTTIKLSTSRQNAFDGVAIDLTGTGNNSQLIIYIPNRDFGGSTLGGNGLLVDAGSAITLVSNRDTAYRTDGYHVIYGVRLGKTVINGSYGLAIGTFGQENRGFIQTSKLLASGIVDQFQNITVKYRGVETVDDKLIVKYRTIDRMDNLKGIDQALTMTATWVNTNRFTTTADLSDAKVGDEVSFHSGSGSGYIAHIESISESGGTYTINLNEVIQNVTGGDTCGFVIENWTRIGEITTADNDYETNDNGDRYMSVGGAKTFNVLKPSKQLEVKIELRGEDVAIEDILVNNRPFKTFVA